MWTIAYYAHYNPRPHGFYIAVGKETISDDITDEIC